MIDEASRALFRDGAKILKGQGILFADENFHTNEVFKGADLRFFTDRLDIAKQLEKLGLRGEISDFDLSVVGNNSQDFVLFRLSKMKLLTHYLLEEAARILKPEGRLVLTGNNQEGIKSVIKSAEKIGELTVMELLGKGLRYANVIKKAGAELHLKGEEYREWIEIRSPEGALFKTKPGIYGYKKIDEGSEFLVQTLKKEALKGDLLDLGCGYGYLSLLLAQQPGVSRLIATDNNIAAVEACRKNLRFLSESLPISVTLDDCGSEIQENSMDYIVCNPPFHQGFSTSKDLTRKFVRAVRRILKRKGAAYFVVNRFIGIEKICEEEQIKFTEIATNRQFKILMLERLR